MDNNNQETKNNNPDKASTMKYNVSNTTQSLGDIKMTKEQIKNAKRQRRAKIRRTAKKDNLTVEAYKATDGFLDKWPLITEEEVSNQPEPVEEVEEVEEVVEEVDESREARLAKKREYDRAYRARKKAEKEAELAA